MSKRLEFSRGADAYDHYGTVFVNGGPSVEVDDDTAEFLLSLTEFDFNEESDEDRRDREAAEKAADAAAARAEKAAEKAAAEAQAAADRTKAFYDAETVEEQVAAGVEDPNVSAPASVVEVEEPDTDDDDEQDHKGARSGAFR